MKINSTRDLFRKLLPTVQAMAVEAMPSGVGIAKTGPDSNLSWTEFTDNPITNSNMPDGLRAILYSRKNTFYESFPKFSINAKT